MTSGNSLGGFEHPGDARSRRASSVSIVVPIHNSETTLARTLQSLFRQSHRDWTAVLVDDGSSDRSLEIARGFAARDPRLTVIAQENQGVSAARNRGIAEAGGDWLLFLDSDDTLHQHGLRRLLAASRSEADIVVGRIERVAAGGRAWSAPPRDLKQPFEVLATHCPFHIHGALVRRTCVLEVGGFDEGLKSNEDWDLWLRIARAGAAFRQTRRLIGFYWRRPGSLSTNAPLMATNMHEVLRRAHSPDPRVPRPAPALADGAPDEAFAPRRLLLCLWSASVDMARGGDPAWIADLVGPDAFAGVPLDPDRLGLAMVDGLAHGLSRPPQGLAGEWPRVAARARQILHLTLPAPETAESRDFILLALKDRLDGRFDDDAVAAETPAVLPLVLDLDAPFEELPAAEGRGLAVQIRDRGRPFGAIFIPASAGAGPPEIAALAAARVGDFAMGRVNRALRPWRHPGFWLAAGADAVQALGRPGRLREAGRLAFARGAERVVRARLGAR